MSSVPRLSGKRRRKNVFFFFNKGNTALYSLNMEPANRTLESREQEKGVNYAEYSSENYILLD